MGKREVSGRWFGMVALVLGLVLAVAWCGEAEGSFRPVGGLLRYPDVSATQVVFVYANDLWIAPREGGVALPLASPPGMEYYPRFSPDGERVAFVGNYDGNHDIYVLPVTGGTPRRLTHHPTMELLSDWTAGDRLVFSAWGLSSQPFTSALFTLSPEGGLPEPLPVPYGAAGTISPDGRWLAYVPSSSAHQSWKRYVGGRADDIWLFDLEKRTSRRLTTWMGMDTAPMWWDGAVYYLSNAGPAHIMNIWRYDLESGTSRQITRFTDLDVRWPALGPGPEGQGEIVFQQAGGLWLLDLGTETTRRIEIMIPGDRRRVRPQRKDAAELIFTRTVSPRGKRVLLEARGDIWSVPVKHGSPRNLTATSGAAERDPSWSPDGRWICYFSDESGEYQLYLRAAGGRGEVRRIGELPPGFYGEPLWSPDSRRIAFWDQMDALWLAEIEEGRVRVIDRPPAPAQHTLSWSVDSRWLAYVRRESFDSLSAIWIWDAKKDEKHRVTSGMFEDFLPAFDREGKYLYFASLRDFSSPQFADRGQTWVYAYTGRLFCVPLTSEIPSPRLPRSDEEGESEDDGGKKKGAGEDGAGKGDAGTKGKAGEGESGKAGDKTPPEVRIEFEGFEGRAVLLPVGRGRFGQLAMNDEGHPVYLYYPPGAGWGEALIRILDPKAEKDAEKTVLEGAKGFELIADGSRMLVLKGEQMAVIPARAEQKIEEPISTAGMDVVVDPRAEWRQIFREAWRLQRDFFYDPQMHGLDWPAIYEKYLPFIEECASREDVAYVIREMQGELNVGHEFHGGGDEERPPDVGMGFLGCDFELDRGAYRISRIYGGGPWDSDARGPLGQPGIDVRVGDYLLAVNHRPLDTSVDPWAAFEGLAGKTVILTVSRKPRWDEDARDVVVQLAGSDHELRYRAWIERNRAYVERKSAGRVGYIYVPSTGIFGQNELMRQFRAQMDREALIIDDRWNRGGQIPTRFIELLNRPVINYWARREYAKDGRSPEESHIGPKCMLINGASGSGGDYFPYLFRKAGLGKLVGTRTWGGLVGISGTPAHIDGSFTSVPSFAFYELDGTWGIEGYGVEPDIEVIDDPALMVDGGDPQLDAAIQLLLEELERNPYRPPPRPPYPDRRGMGIPPEQR
jgi:tricorn protease